MRFMIIVRTTRDMEAGRHGPEPLMAEMATYHQQLSKAGVLLDAAGLQPSIKGWRIRYAGDRRTVVDGPFAETNARVAGYTLIQTKTREEALEWTRRFPNPAPDGGVVEVEVREVVDLDAFAASPSAQKFRELKGDAQ